MTYEEIDISDLIGVIGNDIQEHKFNWKVTVVIYDQDLCPGGAPDDTFVFECCEPKMNDDETERLLLHLFDLSLRKRIVMAHKERSEFNWRKEFVYGYRFDVEKSTDGQTNITPEFIDLLASIKTAYEPITVAKFK